MHLLKPSLDHVQAYTAALHKGWLPDNVRPEAAQEQISKILESPSSFVASLDDPMAQAGPVTLPDGSKVPRLPSIRRWIWDDGFCGHISLRWKPGTEELPPTCLGHLGYTVVPWRQREGLATAAVVGMLPEAKAVGLRFVVITTNPANVASVRVIEKAGGVFVKRYRADKAVGGHETLHYEIALT